MSEWVSERQWMNKCLVLQKEKKKEERGEGGGREEENTEGRR